MIPLEIAEAARAIFLKSEFKQEEQREEGYYDRVDVFPGMEGQTYTANFARSGKCEFDLTEIFYQHVLPETGLKPPGNVYLRAYRMDPGGHYRLHVDDLGDIGFIWYLSKDWKPDWGGLLIQTDSMQVTVPEFNLLVVRKARTPHLVTTIEPWAKEPRYTLVGFF